MKLSKIREEILKDWKVLFDENPTLKKVPVFCWGRYTRYECAGSPFETEEGTPYDLIYSHEMEDDFDTELIKEISEKNRDRIEECEICEYLPLREDMVKHYDFDDRYGMCLYLEKQGEDIFLGTLKCDSPE